MEALTPKERAREKRYVKKYGITLVQYNAILELQGGKCAICGRPATDFTLPLVVDHKHFRVVVEKLAGGREGGFSEAKWMASVEEFDVAVAGRTKAEVIAFAKTIAIARSIRGLLCPGRHGPAGTCCNRNLGRVDNVDWLRKVIAYLENPPARKILDM